MSDVELSSTIALGIGLVSLLAAAIAALLRRTRGVPLVRRFRLMAQLAGLAVWSSLPPRRAVASVAIELLAGAGCLSLILGLTFAALLALGEVGGNVNAPRGNAIGDRHQEFMRVVAYAKTLPVGLHYASALPAELQIKNLLAVYVDDRKAYALEFPSIPIDCNPIYVFIDEGVADPEGVVQAMCRDHLSWRFARRLDEPGWYYVHGP